MKTINEQLAELQSLSDEETKYCELRDWSQDKRDQLAKGEIKGDFAGPNQSFPIASPEDVTAAAHSLGRAKGDQDKIKAAIIRIAKKHGWGSGLPEAWKMGLPNGVGYFRLYSENQPRDDHGRWSEGGGAVDKFESDGNDTSYEAYGLRVVEEGLDDVKNGSELEPSRIWEDSNPTDSYLNGTSSIHIRLNGNGELDRTSIEKALTQLKNEGYSGKTVLLIGGRDCGSGEDKGERIIGGAKVISKLEWPIKMYDSSILINLSDFDPITGEGLSKWIPVLYPGRWNDKDFTPKIITQLAESFNPHLQPVPVKLGHDGDDTQPAVSYIEEVKCCAFTLANGKLVDPCLMIRMRKTNEVVKYCKEGGAYRMRSIEALPPKYPSNPVPEKWFLGALSLLGGARPAVPGLGPTVLSDSTHTTQEATMPTQEDLVKLTEEKKISDAKLAETQAEAVKLKAELETLKTAAAAADAKLAEQAKAAKLSEIKTNLASLKDNLTPAMIQVAEAIMLSMLDDAVIKLNDKDISRNSAFMALLQAIPKHGLTDPLKCPALAGKKSKDDGEDGEDGNEGLSEEEAMAAETKKYMKANPKASMKECTQAARKVLAEKKKELSRKEK